MWLLNRWTSRPDPIRHAGGGGGGDEKRGLTQTVRSFFVFNFFRSTNDEHENKNVNESESATVAIGWPSNFPFEDARVRDLPTPSWSVLQDQRGPSSANQNGGFASRLLDAGPSSIFSRIACSPPSSPITLHLCVSVNRVLPSFTEFYRVLPSFIGFCSQLVGTALVPLSTVLDGFN